MENQVKSAVLYDLMSTSSNGFLVFEASGNTDKHNLRCTFANHSASLLTGFRNLEGLPYQDIFSLTSAQPGENLRSEYRFPESGRNCIIDRSAVSQESVLCTLTEVKRDDMPVYRRKLWQDAEEIMQFGGWIWDIEAGEMQWTDGMYHLMGYAEGALQQEQLNIDFLKRHIHRDDLESFSRQVGQISSYTESYVLEFRITGGDGVEKFLYLRGENVPDQTTGRLFSISTLFNVSTLKLIQNELEQKVSDLNQSNADLEQFAYIASHDLQEPLRKIVSFGERLDQKAKDTLNEEQHLYLDRILNATRRMQEMINNLLEFSRVSSASRVYSEADLNEIMRSTLSDLEVTIQQKKAVITVGELPVIEVMPAQMSQLFQNLISNSLKFTRADVTPVIRITSEGLSQQEVSAKRLSPDQSYVRLLFEDNGIGFENSSSEKIFTIFQRLRGRSEFEGAGIGLAVCKKVVERHHGLIEARGVPGAGATFEIILPCVQN